MIGHGINQMIQRAAPLPQGFTAAQVDKLGGHSLRGRFVNEVFRQGADAHAIMRQTGHHSPVMLEVYAREHTPSSAMPSTVSASNRHDHDDRHQHRRVDTGAVAADPPDLRRGMGTVHRLVRRYRHHRAAR